LKNGRLMSLKSDDNRTRRATSEGTIESRGYPDVEAADQVEGVLSALPLNIWYNQCRARPI